MKKTTYMRFAAALSIFSVMAASCSEDSPALRLGGETELLSFAADGISGIIDGAAKTVTVPVSETYDTGNMEITAVSASEGAEVSFHVGDRLNLSFPQTLTVTNGDVYTEYTVRARHDEARILSLMLDGLYRGVIDDTGKTVTVNVPTTVDVTSMTMSLTLSEGAVSDPASGASLDFTSPVTISVSNNSAQAEYTVTVTQTDAPDAVFVGLASSVDGLDEEAKAAAEWMLENVSNSRYVSFAEISAEAVDMSACKVIWWHFHVDGGIDTDDKFDNAAPDAVAAVQAVRSLYENGTSLLLTRYAAYYAARIGAAADDRTPNNCWGGSEANPEITGNPWSFFITGHEDHPLYEGITTMTEGEKVGIYTCDTGYGITNSTAQWHIGSDWGGYADYATWRSAHGATDLGYGGDGAVVVWEYGQSGMEGGLLCIGSGCYDWYASNMEASSDQYHSNVERLTENAFGYLSSLSSK